MGAREPPARILGMYPRRSTSQMSARPVNPALIPAARGDALFEFIQLLSVFAARTAKRQRHRASAASLALYQLIRLPPRNPRFLLRSRSSGRVLPCAFWAPEEKPDNFSFARDPLRQQAGFDDGSDPLEFPAASGWEIPAGIDLGEALERASGSPALLRVFSGPPLPRGGTRGPRGGRSGQALEAVVCSDRRPGRGCRRGRHHRRRSARHALGCPREGQPGAGGVPGDRVLLRPDVQERRK